MKTTYIASSNMATNGTAIGSDSERDVVVKSVIIGAPVSGGSITFYTITNPVGGASTNIAAKITLPTFSTTNVNPGVYVLNFGPGGLVLNEGGNVVIDQTMQVTVNWETMNDPNA